MKNYRATRVMYLVVLMATTGAFVLLLTTTLQARQRSPIEVFNRERAREREEAERRRTLDRIRDDVRKPPVTDERRRSALVTQIKEDFHLIQVISNEMIRLTFTDRPLVYESLSEKAAEIKKRAARLRAVLRFTPPKDEKLLPKNPEAVDGEQLKSSLLMLRHSISSFVTNPLFQNLGSIDIELSEKASRDLREIIDLSNNIRQTAKRLDKTSR